MSVSAYSGSCDWLFNKACTRKCPTLDYLEASEGETAMTSATLERILPIEQAFCAAREAVLEEAAGKEVYFYRDATLRLENLWPENINPAAVYLLKENLNFQRELRRYLLDRYGIDTLQLSVVVHLKTEKGIIAMIPPYVEVSEEQVRLIPGPEDRESPAKQALRIPILIDGLHRAQIAREEGLPLRCIVCSGNYDAGYLYTAYPAHWSQVQIYDKVPEVKKFYRRQNKYSFMRPLEVMRLTEKGAGGEYGRQ